MLDREDTKSDTESKSREYVALVDERECLARELKCRRGYLKSSKLGENEADVKKGHPLEAGGCKCTKPFQSTTKPERVAVPGTGGNNHNNFETIQNVILAVSSGKGWSRRLLQDCFEGKEYYGGQEFQEFLL